jgi:hypothetical protein
MSSAFYNFCRLDKNNGSWNSRYSKKMKTGTEIRVGKDQHLTSREITHPGVYYPEVF